MAINKWRIGRKCKYDVDIVADMLFAVLSVSGISVIHQTWFVPEWNTLCEVMTCTVSMVVQY
jgi:hypothetical protein